MHFARLVKKASADRVLRHICLWMTLHILACMLTYLFRQKRDSKNENRDEELLSVLQSLSVLFQGDV